MSNLISNFNFSSSLSFEATPPETFFFIEKSNYSTFDLYRINFRNPRVGILNAIRGWEKIPLEKSNYVCIAWRSGECFGRISCSVDQKLPRILFYFTGTIIGGSHLKFEKIFTKSPSAHLNNFSVHVVSLCAPILQKFPKEIMKGAVLKTDANLLIFLCVLVGASWGVDGRRGDC